MSKEFAALNAQVAGLNAQLGKMIDTSQAVDARGYERLSKAAALNSSEFRKAAASTGMFDVQQVRLNSATDEYIKKLNAQKMGFRELMRTRKIAHAAYREQLAMESMLVKKAPSGTVSNKEVFDVVTPKQYDEALNTAGRRLSMFNQQLKSGATQMINWGKNTQWAGRQLMVGFTIPLVAFGAAAGVMAYRLDSEFTRVRKVYDTTADSTSGNMQDMIAVQKELEMVTKASTQTAITAAKEYGQAATDTISVQADLAATGKTGNELQQNTLQVMRIARLGEIEYQTATEATIALQSIFRMSNDELTQSFNYMNAVENATSLSTADFAQAIPVAASAVKAWGGDIKELGILLTAMKENGIAASEGANAIKATMQRLARPSKQVREEWQALTGVDIMSITENADGLVDVFTQINDVTKDLSDSDRRKAFAGLFGSYQVSRMMALTKGMGELEQGIGQVSDAYRIAGKAPEEWRQIAENELTQYRNSISGQFKTTIENLKVQLAEMGAPFVQAATTALKAITMLIEGFNNLPSAAKWSIAFAAGIAAIAGPIVMLTGLFANLIGNGLLMGATMLGQFAKLLGVMKILPKESRINALASEMMEKSYVSQAKAVQGLTAELEKLVAAQAAANKSSAQMVANTANIKKSKALIAQEARIAEHARLTGFMNNTYGQVGIDQKIRYFDPNTGRRLKDAEALTRARADMAAEDAKIAAAAKVTATETEKTRRNLTGAAVAGGALAAGMVLTMTNSNETANEIGNMLIMGSLVVPAAIELSKALYASSKYIKLGIIAEKAGLVYSKSRLVMENAINGAKMRGVAAMEAQNLAAASGAGLLGRMGALIGGFMNPWTLAIGAVAAVGVGIYAWKKHLEKVREEQTKLHHEINTMADTWAEKLGIVRKEYEKIAGVQQTIGDKNKYQTYLDAYNSGDLKANRDAFASNDINAEQRVTMARAQFATLIRDYGLSFQDASMSLQAMYESAGLSLRDANAVIAGLQDEFGSGINGGEAMQIKAELMVEPGQTEETAHETATLFGRSFGQALSEASPGAESSRLMDYFTKVIDVGWNGALDNVIGQSDALKDKFAEMGIDSGDALRKAVEESGSMDNFIETLFPADQFGYDFQAQISEILTNGLDPAIKRTTAIMGGLTGPNSPFAFLPADINNLTDLAAAFEGVQVAAQGISWEEAQKLLAVLQKPLPSAAVQSMLPGMNSLEQSIYAAGNATDRLNKFNAILVAQGYEPVTSEAEMLNWTADQLPGKIDDATAAARRLSAGMAAVLANLGQIGKEAMSATQSAFAGEYTDYMNAQYDAELQSTQDQWDKRVEQVSSNGERARAALDKVWEKRNDAAEKYWDHRIDLVDKAIKAEEDAEKKREKMFDAEIARIEKLNDLANANIDFNVALNEGKLDEAAKLRNDMQAQSDSQTIERSRDQMSGASEKRVDRLGNRKDRLEKQKEAAMKAMQKEEDAQKAHLERMTQANQKAVEQQRDDALAAEQAKIDAQKKAMEHEVEMFMAGTATSKRELIKRMKEAGLDYKDFYRDVIKPQGLKWGEYFGSTLKDELKKSADAIRTDAMWEQLGSDSLGLMARGMGFSGKRGLMHFLKTGEIKEFSENKPAPPNAGQGNSGFGPGGPPEGRHEGGIVGSGGGSRKGVASNYKGIHPSETMLLAQKGEFVVNKRAAKKHGDLLNAINAKDGHDGVGGLGGGMGPAPFFAAAFTRAMATKTNEALGNAVTAKKAQMANMAIPGFMGAFGTLGTGTYGNTSFGPDQVANARLIASIGKNMGMSTRDIEIAIMTAITESSLINNPGGDRDSVGLFQQRPSQGWGTYAQVSNPTYAATKFYSVLRGVAGRDTMAPWLAAQAVQRSAYSDGSNYQQYWDEALAMYAAMQATPPTGVLPGAGPGGGYVPGAGGRHRPVMGGSVSQGIHDDNAIDISIPIGATTYAIADGRVTGSYDIPGYEPRRMIAGVTGPSIQDGLRSYGRVITIDHGGYSSLYAHLSRRAVAAGQTVRGGAIIGATGNAGNVQSSIGNGAHLHFGVPGGNPYSFLGLRKGAAEVRFDNTVANLHKGEAVLTKDINQQFRQGVANFANGGGDEYTVIVNPSEGMNEERLANRVVKKIETKQRRRPVTRTVGSR